MFLYIPRLLDSTIKTEIDNTIPESFGDNSMIPMKNPEEANDEVPTDKTIMITAMYLSQPM